MPQLRKVSVGCLLLAAVLVYLSEMVWAGGERSRAAVLAKAAYHGSAGVLGILGALAFHSDALARKLGLVILGFWTMLLSKDKSWSKKKVPDPDQILGMEVETKRILFIRHGESKWNETFNKGFYPPAFARRIFKALAEEAACLFSFDSVLFDSPLNSVGIEQAVDLATALESLEIDAVAPADAKVLRADAGAPTSVVCSSNLRRAAQTAVLSLWGRLGRTHEKVVVVSALQEISRNIDTLSLAPARRPVPLPGVAERLAVAPLDGDKVFAASDNRGNKPIFGTGLQRMDTFCGWAFARKEDAVICGGHSLWFRSFFRTYLPTATSAAAKDSKMCNGGCVAFDLTRAQKDGRYVYRIPPESVKEVFLGFEQKKSKKK